MLNYIWQKQLRFRGIIRVESSKKHYFVAPFGIFLQLIDLRKLLRNCRDGIILIEIKENCVILYEVYTQSFSPAKENIGGHFESGSLAGTVKQNGVDYRADS